MTCKDCEDAARICDAVSTAYQGAEKLSARQCADSIRAACRHVNAEAEAVEGDVIDALRKLIAVIKPPHMMIQEPSKEYVDAYKGATRALDLSKINAAPQSSTAEAQPDEATECPQCHMKTLLSSFVLSWCVNCKYEEGHND